VASAQSVSALREELNALGYVEGRNTVIEFRWAEGRYERLSEYAAALKASKADVIVTFGSPGTLALKAATSTIPIVFLTRRRSGRLGARCQPRATRRQRYWRDQHHAGSKDRNRFVD